MHELTIARSILATIASAAPLEPGERYAAVRLRVGAISGVEAEALMFGLEVLSDDRGWPGIEFRIERIPMRRRCQACRREFTVVGHDATCPGCGATRTILAGGDELEIAGVDVERA